MLNECYDILHIEDAIVCKQLSNENNLEKVLCGDLVD